MAKYDTWLQNLARGTRRQVEGLATRSLASVVRRASTSSVAPPPRVSSRSRHYPACVADVLAAVEEFCEDELWEWRCKARPVDRCGLAFEYSGRLRLTKRTAARPDSAAFRVVENWYCAQGERPPWGELVTVPHEFSCRILVRVPDLLAVGCVVEVSTEERIDPRNNVLAGGALAVPSLLPAVAVEVPLHEFLRQRVVSPALRLRPRTGTASGAAALCRDSLSTLIDLGALPDYVPSGKFRPTGQRMLLNDEALARAHYAHCLGPLYHNELAWRRAYEFVHSFTRKRRTAPVSLLGLFGPFAYRVAGQVVPRSPQDVLSLVCHALASLGARERSRDDLTHTATFELTESCSAADLPEPYGKWLQHEGRAPWPRGRVELEVLLSAHAYPGRHRNSDGSEHDVTLLDLSLSTLAVPLVCSLGQALVPLLSPGCVPLLPSTGPRLVRAHW